MKLRNKGELHDKKIGSLEIAFIFNTVDFFFAFTISSKFLYPYYADRKKNTKTIMPGGIRYSHHAY